MKARVVGDTDVIVVNWGNDVQRLGAVCMYFVLMR